MDEKLNPKDKVLLMRDEGEGNKLKVVRGIDKKGKIDAIDPMKAKQTDFIKIDKHADPLENFFTNFFNQAKNPSHTGFYEIAVQLDFLSLYQLVIKSRFWRGNELVTVLLACVCTALYSTEKLNTKIVKDFIMKKY